MGLPQYSWWADRMYLKLGEKCSNGSAHEYLYPGCRSPLFAISNYRSHTKALRLILGPPGALRVPTWPGEPTRFKRRLSWTSKHNGAHPPGSGGMLDGADGFFSVFASILGFNFISPYVWTCENPQLSSWHTGSLLWIMRAHFIITLASGSIMYVVRNISQSPFGHLNGLKPPELERTKVGISYFNPTLDFAIASRPQSNNSPWVFLCSISGRGWSRNRLLFLTHIMLFFDSY